MATSPKIETHGSGRADDETMAAIYEGVNQGQLMAIFKMDHRTIKTKLFKGRVKPVGKRAGSDIYALHEVAPYLVKPIFDVATYLKQMDPRELPKHLSKEFWAGQRSRQEYEEKAGQLWKTEKIVEEVGELMKLVKMSALLMVDAIERQSELNDKQREIVKSLTHGMLNDLMERVESKFQTPDDQLPDFEPDEQLQEAEDDEEL